MCQLPRSFAVVTRYIRLALVVMLHAAGAFELEGLEMAVGAERFPDKPEGGTLTLHFAERGKATVRAYGPDGVELAGFLNYLSEAYKVVERDTGKSPMCLLAPFADETGQGTEVTVVPSDEPARAQIIG